MEAWLGGRGCSDSDGLVVAAGGGPRGALVSPAAQPGLGRGGEAGGGGRSASTGTACRSRGRLACCEGDEQKRSFVSPPSRGMLQVWCVLGSVSVQNTQSCGLGLGCCEAAERQDRAPAPQSERLCCRAKGAFGMRSTQALWLPTTILGTAAVRRAPTEVTRLVGWGGVGWGGGEGGGGGRGDGEVSLSPVRKWFWGWD